MASSAVAIASGLVHCSNESCCECWWSSHPCFSLSANPEKVRYRRLFLVWITSIVINIAMRLGATPWDCLELPGTPIPR